MGLKKRLEHTGCHEAVIGPSGGLDSTLALLVTVRAFDSLRIPRSGIHLHNHALLRDHRQDL